MFFTCVFHFIATHDISVVFTPSILSHVMSIGGEMSEPDMKKRKLGYAGVADDTGVAFNPVLQSWANDALDILLQIQWLVTGHEVSTPDGSEATELSKDTTETPIYTCPSCRVVGSASSQVSHMENCRIRLLVRQYFNMKQLTSGSGRKDDSASILSVV